MKNGNDSKAKNGGTILQAKKKANLYSLISQYTKEAVYEIVALMRESKNPNIRFAAARLIIDKTIADVKAVEITGKDGGPIRFNVITGSDYLSYLSKLRESHASSNRSFDESAPEVQGTYLAQKSEENDNSNNTVDQMGAA